MLPLNQCVVHSTRTLLSCVAGCVHSSGKVAYLRSARGGEAGSGGDDDDDWPAAAPASRDRLSRL